VNVEIWTEDTAHNNQMCLVTAQCDSVHAKELWKQRIGISLHHVLYQHQTHFSLTHWVFRSNSRSDQVP